MIAKLIQRICGCEDNENGEKIEVAMVTNHFVISGIGIVIMNYREAREALDIRKYDLTILAGQTIAGKIGKGMSKNGMTC